MDLCQKYAPKASTEMLGSPTAICAISAWLKQRRRDASPACLLISGEPGVGTTTAARLCLREAGYEVIENNASHVRTGKELKQQLSFLRSVTHSMFDHRPKALFVDEVDALYANDTGGGDELTKYMAQVQKSTKWMVPVICTCRQHHHGKMLDLTKKGEVVVLPQIPANQLQALADTVQHGEGTLLPRDSVAQLVQQVRGDARQLLVQLEMVFSSRSHHASSSNDVLYDVTMATTKLLQGSKACDVPEALMLFGTDVSIVPLMVHENYLDLAAAGRRDMKIVAACADSISYSGVVEEQMYKQQAWELYDHYGVNSTLVPAHHCSHKGKKDLRFGTLWSKISNTFSKKKQLRRLNSRVCNKTSPCLTTFALLRDTAHGLVVQHAWESLLQLCQDYNLEYSDLYLLMKHSSLSPIKSSYRPSTHARVKKALIQTHKQSRNRTSREV